MPCVYLPGPAPAVTVANNNWEMNIRQFFQLPDASQFLTLNLKFFRVTDERLFFVL